MSQLEPNAAYAAWAERYPPFAHNALMQVEEEAVLALLPRAEGRVAVDAGCGTGRYTRALGGRGAGAVIGIDRSHAMLIRARLLGHDVALADLSAIPLAAATVDLVVAGLVLNDVADLGSVVRECARVLRPEGVLVASMLHPRGADSRWTRTFEADGRVWSLPAHWHSLRDFETAAAAAGLAIDTHHEPELAGRGKVALVIRARRC